MGTPHLQCLDTPHQEARLILLWARKPANFHTDDEISQWCKKAGDLICVYSSRDLRKILSHRIFYSSFYRSQWKDPQDVSVQVN